MIFGMTYHEDVATVKDSFKKKLAFNRLLIMYVFTDVSAMRSIM